VHARVLYWSNHKDCYGSLAPPWPLGWVPRAHGLKGHRDTPFSLTSCTTHGSESRVSECTSLPMCSVVYLLGRKRALRRDEGTTSHRLELPAPNRSPHSLCRALSGVLGVRIIEGSAVSVNGHSARYHSETEGSRYDMLITREH
jgi:hypothetical protein